MTDSRDQPKLAVSRQSVARDSLGLYVIGIIGCSFRRVGGFHWSLEVLSGGAEKNYVPVAFLVNFFYSKNVFATLDPDPDLPEGLDRDPQQSCFLFCWVTVVLLPENLRAHLQLSV
jgi:hypothetical protein